MISKIIKRKMIRLFFQCNLCVQINSTKKKGAEIKIKLRVLLFRRLDFQWIHRRPKGINLIFLTFFSFLFISLVVHFNDSPPFLFCCYWISWHEWHEPRDRETNFRPANQPHTQIRKRKNSNNIKIQRERDPVVAFPRVISISLKTVFI